MSEMKLTHKDIIRAAEILGLSDRATIEEIKVAYHRLAKKFHPDSTSGSGDPEKFMEASWAYQVLMSYVSHYKIDFTEEAFIRNFPEERLRRRFFSDPLWGPGKPKSK